MNIYWNPTKALPIFLSFFYEVGHFAGISNNVFGQLVNIHTKLWMFSNLNNNEEYCINSQGFKASIWIYGSDQTNLKPFR